MGAYEINEIVATVKELTTNISPTLAQTLFDLTWAVKAGIEKCGCCINS